MLVFKKIILFAGASIHILDGGGGGVVKVRNKLNKFGALRARSCNITFCARILKTFLTFAPPIFSLGGGGGGQDRRLCLFVLFYV